MPSSSDHTLADVDVRGLGRRRFLGLGAAAGGAVVLGSAVRPTRAAQAEPAAEVQSARGAALVAARRAVPASRKVGNGYRVTAQALGVNTTSGDRNFADAPVPALLKAAGIGRVRYPGGGGADSFNWLSPTAGLPWPAFMTELAAFDAQPMITVDYGTLNQGPDAAAAWVADALTYPNYVSDAAIWVLSNEEYGPWETDQHPNPHTPESFATYVRPYFQAMHAVEAGTRVGFPMTIDRQIAGGTGTWVPDPDSWNRVVLERNADEVDFIDFHWYPVFGIPVLTNAELFQTVQRIPEAWRYLTSVVTKYDRGTPIVVSESNISQSEIVYNTQPVSALYAVTTGLRFLSLGAESYMWWQVHNSDNMNGDFGFLSNGSGSPGPTVSSLAAAAAAGAVTLTIADTSGFHYAHRIDIGDGASAESRKITALPGTTSLAAPAAAGATRVSVTETSTLTTAGATTDYHQLFAPGTPVTVGSGGSAETRTVTDVGTAAGTAQLAAPAASGERTLRIVGVGMGGQSIPVFLPTSLAPGAVLTIGSGGRRETVTVKDLGTASSLGTTLAAPARQGDDTVHVVSVTDTNTGIANYVGDPITIDTGSTQEVRTIVDVGSSAAAPTTTVAPVTAGQRTVHVLSTQGVAVGHPLLVGADDGSGIITAPVVSIGAQASAVLAAPAAAGDTVLRLGSTTGFLAGHPIVVDTGAGQEIRTIRNVGSAGATGSGVTLTSALGAAHAVGATVVDAGTGVTLAGPVARAFPAGVAARDLGTGITLSAPLKRDHATGTPTRDAGTGITLTRPLVRSHPDAETVTTPGTGIALDRPLTARHADGEAVASTAVTITPALSGAHPAGTSVGETGLKEPPLDTPLPAYWGFVLAAKMAAPGSVVSELTTGDDAVYAFSSTLSGTTSLCLVNIDDTRPLTVTVTGVPTKSGLTTFDYGLENPAVVQGSTAGGELRSGLDLAPESIKIVQFTGGAARHVVRVHR